METALEADSWKLITTGNGSRGGNARQLREHARAASYGASVTLRWVQNGGVDPTAAAGGAAGRLLPRRGKSQLKNA